MPSGCYEHKTTPLADRFWPKVRKTETCWLWIGGKTKAGYGMTYMNGRLILAHRASWILVKGIDPGEMQVLHHCDVPNCVNPEHLFLGNAKDNLAEMARKKRGTATFTADQVREIRKAAQDGVSQRILARRWGVTQAAIWCVLHRWTYAHVENQPDEFDQRTATGD